MAKGSVYEFDNGQQCEQVTDDLECGCCGGTYAAARHSDGTEALIHSYPYCEDFLNYEPQEFIAAELARAIAKRRTKNGPPN